MRSAYQEALKRAKKRGGLKDELANSDDAARMALICDGALMHLVGAASPELVWSGAQKKGMTTRELLELANKDPNAVHDLMWI